jgi:adenylyl-sulfate kinase
MGFVLWLTGYSGSGKTTIAKAIEKELKNKNIKIERLDGDTVRQHLTKDLGFSKEDRNTNIERIIFVSKLLSRNNIGVIVSFISPYEEMRNKAKQETTNFIECHINCPIEICEKRDVKGLYKKARNNEIKNLTGINDPYEIPTSPDLILNTDKETIEQSTNKAIQYLKNNNYI